MRDDFSQETKDTLFKRAQAKCSNPECRKPTSGAHSEEDKSVNIGVAAHITAASPGGYRYDPTLTSNERKHIRNGIWLCQSCAKLIDSDEPKYAVEILHAWKIVAERGDEREAAKMALFNKAEKMMPDLLEAIRQDLSGHPLRREVVIYKKSVTYNAGGNELYYHHEDHESLEDKMTILCGLHLIKEITYNNIRRFNLTEDFVEYLIQG